MNPNSVAGIRNREAGRGPSLQEHRHQRQETFGDLLKAMASDRDFWRPQVRVLVADGNRGAVDLAATLLERQGMRVRKVALAERVLPEARRFRPDVLLLGRPIGEDNDYRHILADLANNLPNVGVVLMGSPGVRPPRLREAKTAGAFTVVDAASIASSDMLERSVLAAAGR